VSRDGLLLRIGPAGNSESFYAAGYQQTVDTFAWQQANFGLDAFELPFGRGISMSADTASRIGQAARAAGVSLSAHAPYYINLANPDPELAERSIQYILRTARLLQLAGGQRVVVHVGSPKGQERAAAMALCTARLKQARAELVDQGLGQVHLCLETMGRPSVLGTLEEVLRLVQVDDSFLPCVDFAHLHAISQGAMLDEAAFARVLDLLEAALGWERARLAHMHFSRIEYGAKGEIRHKTFDDLDFGPDFAHLAPLLANRRYAGTLICESRGTMAEDASAMRQALLALQVDTSAFETLSNPHFL